MSPGLIERLILTAIVLAAAALVRVLAIPRFTFVPGGFQLLLEEAALLTDRVIAFCVGLVLGTGQFLRDFARGFAAFLVRLGRAMAKLARERTRALIVWAASILVPLALSFLAGSHGGHEDVQTAMRDAVLHNVNRVSLFGWLDVNPGLIAAMTVTGILLTAALLIRLLVIPRFSQVPGRFQLALETIVNTLDGLARSAGRHSFIGAYVFAAGVYIFTGTLFELFGVQGVTTEGVSIALPAPLSDVNAAIAMGCLSYLVIVCGGAVHRGGKGIVAALKEFSLPISMSFRLFGALLSGLLVTELVYHYAALRYGLPVIVAVVFTLLHAIVQTYVLTMLVGMYYGEVTEEEEEAEEPAALPVELMPEAESKAA